MSVVQSELANLIRSAIAGSKTAIEKELVNGSLTEAAFNAETCSSIALIIGDQLLTFGTAGIAAAVVGSLLENNKDHEAIMGKLDKLLEGIDEIKERLDVIEEELSTLLAKVEGLRYKDVVKALNILRDISIMYINDERCSPKAGEAYDILNAELELLKNARAPKEVQATIALPMLIACFHWDKQHGLEIFKSRCKGEKDLIALMIGFPQKQLRIEQEWSCLEKLEASVHEDMRLANQELNDDNTGNAGPYDPGRYNSSIVKTIKTITILGDSVGLPVISTALAAGSALAEKKRKTARGRKIDAQERLKIATEVHDKLPTIRKQVNTRVQELQAEIMEEKFLYSRLMTWVNTEETAYV